MSTQVPNWDILHGGELYCAFGTNVWNSQICLASQRQNIFSLVFFFNTMRNKVSTSEGISSVIISNWLTERIIAIPLPFCILEFEWVLMDYDITIFIHVHGLFCLWLRRDFCPCWVQHNQDSNVNLIFTIIPVYNGNK